ncbi:MAG: NADH-quinone oxidoreductase subunit L [Actinomycetota bacterium]
MSTLALIPGLPLLGAVLLLVVRKPFARWAGTVASLAVGGSFLASLVIVGKLAGLPATERVVKAQIFDWISVGSFKADMSFRADPLTIIMLLVVTGVGTLIHIYSIGYMAHDDRRSTFFAYLNLFAAGMLVLVLAGNFLVLFLGWESVGLCSYLLISFWSFKPSAAAAGKKAFITNRVGDFGFLIAIFLLSGRFGTLDMETIFKAASAHPLMGSIATAIPLLLLLGATGKSAQIPLYIWLPDAMEGPTPVSALIHAATMVTAGVYLIARAHVLFEASHVAGMMVIIIGIVTAFVAASMAVVQNDIKRVLAYSTISQIGYMFVAVGVGAVTGSAIAYVAGIFHLVTHAFFKALLFLGAGSVMHSIDDETDMRKMGGLFKKIPVTGATFVIGWLAISGIPPLAGFFSKDAILSVAWAADLPLVWMIGVAIAGITAFYMSRQVFLTFFGKSRLPEGVEPHESGESMTVVLRALALLAVLGGAIDLTLHGGWLTRFLEPVFASHGRTLGATPAGLPEWLVSAFIALVSLGAMALAFRLYLTEDGPRLRLRFRTAAGGFATVVEHKYYVDEFYNLVAVWPGKMLARFLAFGVDRVIDGTVEGTGAIVTAASRRLRVTQTGFVRRYVMTMFTGAVLVLAFFILRNR